MCWHMINAIGYRYITFTAKYITLLLSRRGQSFQQRKQICIFQMSLFSSNKVKVSGVPCIYKKKKCFLLDVYFYSDAS